MLEEIKSRYITAYDYALICAEYLGRKINSTLSEDEVGYIALHIQLSLNDQSNDDKKKILIVCSTGRGSAALLEDQFERKYGKYIRKVTLCDCLSISKMDLSQFDYIFSTIPLEKIDRPYLLISNFMDSHDDKKILNILENDWERFISVFRKELFMPHLDVANKEDAIRQMCERMKQYCEIPDGFMDSVIKRENMASTRFAANIAMPHPYAIQTDDTFIAVGILDKPLEWDDDGKVRIIFLCSFAADFARNNGKFFECLSDIISSEITLKELSHAEDYETFVKVMKEKLRN